MILNRFKKIEIIKGMFSDHNEMKLESYMRNLTRIFLKYLEIKQCSGQCEVLPPQSQAVESPQLGPLPRTRPWLKGASPPPPGQLLWGAGGARVGDTAQIGTKHLLLQHPPALQPRPPPVQQLLRLFGVAEG